MSSQISASPESLRIEIFADVICPWCYIGKKRLDAALAQRPHITPRIVWRTFLLNPTMPAEGMHRAAYLAAKFGHLPAGLQQREARHRHGLKQAWELLSGARSHHQHLASSWRLGR